jgi:hypothetical protein
MAMKHNDNYRLVTPSGKILLEVTGISTARLSRSITQVIYSYHGEGCVGAVTYDGLQRTIYFMCCDSPRAKITGQLPAIKYEMFLDGVSDGIVELEPQDLTLGDGTVSAEDCQRLLALEIGERVTINSTKHADYDEYVVTFERKS